MLEKMVRVSATAIVCAEYMENRLDGVWRTLRSDLMSSITGQGRLVDDQIIQPPTVARVDQFGTEFYMTALVLQDIK